MKLVIGSNNLAAAAEGAARAAGAPLDRLDVQPVHNASKGFVNDRSADVCELAIVTLLQAAAYDKPVALLPVTTLGRYQHQTLVTCSDLTVEDIEGQSVGVRSWSQTTGVWVRGFLTEQYGVDLRALDWRGYEDGHVDGYTDPAWIKRAPAGDRLQKDFLEGRLDFGIMGNELPSDERIHTAIKDADQASEAWSVQKGFAPINHVVGVSLAAASEHSAAICAIYDAMAGTVAQSGRKQPVDFTPAGFAALRGPLSQAAAYALEQDVLPRPVEFDELVEQTCAALGVPPSRLGG
jgi:4,5-dihydroxyphthalate decarboxylase